MVQEYDTLQRRKLIVEVIDLERIKMGDITLSRVVQGYWRLTSWGWSPDELLHHMNECLKRGVTTFDWEGAGTGSFSARQDPACDKSRDRAGRRSYVLFPLQHDVSSCNQRM